MATGYTVMVFQGNIVRLIQIGDGATWIRAQAWEIRAAAVMLAPNRTGTLAASHIVLQNRDVYTGRFQKGYSISANTYYAGWVAKGTGLYGPRHMIIKPRPPKKAFKIRDGTKPRLIRKSRGQRPNNWLERAARMVL